MSAQLARRRSIRRLLALTLVHAAAGWLVACRARPGSEPATVHVATRAPFPAVEPRSPEDAVPGTAAATIRPTTLVPATGLPCQAPFAAAFVDRSATDVQRQALLAWVWLDGVARAHVIVTPDEAGAEQARCYAVGPHRGLNLANWCCRPDAPAEIEALRIAPADVAAPPPTATVTASGLAYRVITLGTRGAHPSGTDRVTVHYRGWTTDGALFDSSYARGSPTTLPLDRVIEGWTEGVQLMTVGEKTLFWIPESLAYRGQAGHPAGTLVFEIELLAIE